MLRDELHLSTELHDNGCAPPVLELRGRSRRTSDHAWTLDVRILVHGLSAAHAERIQAEIARQAVRGASLLLGPPGMATMLDDPHRLPGLDRIVAAYGLSAAELADKAGISLNAARRALAGGRVYSKTRARLLRLISRMATHPTPGEIIRTKRVLYHQDADAIARRIGVPLATYRAWERDDSAVPPELRGALRRVLHITHPIWPDDDPAPALDGRQPCKTTLSCTSRRPRPQGQTESSPRPNG